MIARTIRRRHRPRSVLVLGGARSGKSRLAESVLAAERGVTYVACGNPVDDADPEWAQRVATHRARRPAGWTTVETRDLPAVLTTPGDPALIDCLGTWLAGVMDDCGVWTAADPAHPAAAAAVADAALAARVDALVAAWVRPARRVVAVSNEVGSGVVPATVSGRRFRDELGALNARVAAASDQVWLVTAGLGQRLK